MLFVRFDRFTGNTAQSRIGSGGAMYVQGGAFNASQLTLTDNSAGVGGGVFLVTSRLSSWSCPACPPCAKQTLAQSTATTWSTHTYMLS
jgi:hypothetical protein